MKTMLDIMHEEKLFLDEGSKKGTDKLTKHPYSRDYERIFEKYHDKEISLLEIGAYYGASTIMWDKYFSKGEITVVDINQRTALENIKDRVDENRTRILIADAYDLDFVKDLPRYDIINDDGPHDLESMTKCVKLYYPKLNNGGVMLIEDIPDSAWFDVLLDIAKKFGGNLIYECLDYSRDGGTTDSRVLVLYKD